ncbi:hypothetical protein RHMOL_Rhmol12G0171300 [Rhododendron molle]|uniref:Uncharacterized protein n=1 Tax=Rhododendron molle TaxID=49168 RepID=A0ACC0LJE0_RHOML|nr:hypothetical protein RHMOL_Rhmol12G0171300 [Rhododendron molle]
MSKFFPTSHLTSIPFRNLSTHHTLCKPLPFVPLLTPSLPSRFSLSSPLSNPRRPLSLHPLPDSCRHRNLSIRAFDLSSETQKDESAAEKEKDPADSDESGGDNGSVVKPDEEYPSGEFVFEEFGAWKKFVVKLRMLIEFPWRRVRKGSVLTMQLRGQVSDQLKSRFSSGLSLPQICENFIKAAYDPRIAGVYLHIEPLNCGWGKVEEIRRHILDFKKSGIDIIFP